MLQRPPDHPLPEGAAEGEGLEVWEVFRQEKEGDAMRHAGNVLAPDRVLALHYAREFYSRRQESVRLWVVARRDVHELEDLDLLQPPMDRSFKKPGGYVMRDKLAAARDRTGAPKGAATAGRATSAADDTATATGDETRTDEAARLEAEA